VLVRTDDEVYRVDAVWLGPPRATFPWRARYVSYGLGLFVMVFLMFVQRRLGIGLDFFSIAWSLIATVLITRFLGKRIDYERPLGQIITLFKHEVTGPRPRAGIRGGLVHAGHVRGVETPGRQGREAGPGEEDQALGHDGAEGAAACAGVTVVPRRRPTRRSPAAAVVARWPASPACPASPRTSRCVPSTAT
jgi:hypothetical protein